MVHTYLIAYWLLPKTFFKQKYLLAAIGLFVLLINFSVIELIVSNELVFRVFDENKVFGPNYLNLSNIIISGIGNHYIILVFLAIKAGMAWVNAETQKAELMQVKVETELEIYRYQLQPKIILSLIDELYITIEKEPERGSEMIVKLSNFLNRFMLEGADDLIPLSLEVKLIEDFLEIHKYALFSRLTSNYIVNGKLQSRIIPPLLILPFINCAIKLAYNCNNLFESTVIIKAEKEYLLFTFSFWGENEFRINNMEETEIAKKRLGYAFPGKYRLKETKEDNFLELTLEIFN